MKYAVKRIDDGSYKHYGSGGNVEFVPEIARAALYITLEKAKHHWYGMYGLNPGLYKVVGVKLKEVAIRLDGTRRTGPATVGSGDVPLDIHDQKEVSDLTAQER